jgi:hypothetical protein
MNASGTGMSAGLTRIFFLKKALETGQTVIFRLETGGTVGITIVADQRELLTVVDTVGPIGTTIFARIFM